MLIALAGVALALLPLRAPGFPDTADGAIHVYRTLELSRLWQDGILYPRWAPDLVFGLGYPLYDFYAPLFYFLAQLFHSLGLNLDQAIKLELALILLLGAGGMYLFAREWLGSASAVAASLAYTYAPFRLREVYFQGDYPQFLALALLPLILWAAHRTLQTEGRSCFLALTLTYTALVLSHSITAMLFTPILLAYTLVIIALFRPSQRAIFSLGTALLLALGLSAFFWLPALYDRQYVNLDVLRQGDFDFRRHFISLMDMVAPTFPLDSTMINPPQPFSLGLAQLIIGLPAGITALARKASRGITLFMGAVLALGVFMMLPVSTVVWQAMPILAFAEFPWRFLGIAALPLAFTVGLSVRLIPARHITAFLALTIIAMELSSASLFYPRGPYREYWQDTLADVTRFELRSKALGTTSAGEYLPKWVERKPTTSPLVAQYLSSTPIDKMDRATLPPGAEARALEHTAQRDRYSISSPIPFAAVFHTIYYPGWNAYLDGRRTEVTATPLDGLIQVQIPAGDHQLLLAFEDTPLRSAANVVSLDTLGVLITIALLGSRKKTARKDDIIGQTKLLSGTQVTALLGLVTALALAKVTFIDTQTSWFRYSSDLEHPPGAETYAQVNFADQIGLLGYAVDQSHLRPGGTLEVTLFWRALAPLNVEYSSFVHLVDSEKREIVAQADIRHPGGIPTRLWPLDRFARDEHVLQVPSAIPSGAYYIRVGVYDLLAYAQRPFGRLNIVGTQDNEYYLPRPVLLNEIPAANIKELRRFTLGDGIRLVDYRISGAALKPGGETKVSLYWRAEKVADRDYTVFVHLYDRNGKLVAGADGQPVDGKYPMTMWLRNQLVEDIHTLRPDPSLPPGRYRIAVGLYDLNTGQRLEARDQGMALVDNAIFLTPELEMRGP